MQSPSTADMDRLLPPNTPAWIFQVWAAFLLAVFALAVGIYYAPMDRWIRAFFFMGMFFTIGSTLTLAKTIRDNRKERIDTPAWVFQSWAAFLLSTGITFAGVLWLPGQVSPWIQGYLAVAIFFAISSSFTLSKTIRDEHEGAKVLQETGATPTPPLLKLSENRRE